MSTHGRILIYSLIDPATGRCLYVGQTRNIRSRICCHKRNKMKGIPFGLKYLGSSDTVMGAAKKEAECLTAKRLFGEAQMNEATPRNAVPRGYNCQSFICHETGAIFHGYNSIGRWLGWNGGTVSNAHKRYGKDQRNFSLDGYTFSEHVAEGQG